MSETPLGKAGDSTRRPLGAFALCTARPRPGAAARPPEARRGRPASQLLCSTQPPSAVLLRSHPPGRGAGPTGCERSPPSVLTSARASVRPRWGCCWDCGAGEAPTDLNRACPIPPDPSVAPSGGAGTRGQAPRRREEAAPVGRRGAGASAGPRLEGGLGSDYLEEQRRPGTAPRYPHPHQPRARP